MNPTLKKFLPFIIVILGVLLLLGMASLKPEPKKVEKKALTPLVETEIMTKQSVQMDIYSTGIVRSVSEINLVSEVAGKIISKSDKMINGGFFKKGDLLYRIDPSDYQLQLNATKAEVAIQQVNYDREMQEQEIAKEEWDYYSKNNPNEVANDLALRKPQLAMAKANLDAAKARLAISEKNLKRSYIYAPFNGSVISKMMDVGQFVGPGTSLAKIFNSDKSQITVSVDPHKSSFISIGNSVEVSAKNYNKEKAWLGKVISVGGSLDAQSRLINVTIEVDKPYENEFALLNGMFVNVKILGQNVDNVYDISIYSLRNKSVVWTVSEDNRLKIVPVQLIHIQDNRAVISAEIEENTKLITSNLSLPNEGMLVRSNNE